MVPHRPKTLHLIGFIILSAFVVGLLYFSMNERTLTPIKIGMLHSTSGTMEISERPLIEAATFAMEEINAQGGIAGHPIQLVIADGKSDAQIFAKEAERLITKEQVQAIFGCWTSECRKAIKPIVEKHHNLLFYPVQYEGLESSPNIIYTGAPPNLQIILGVSWVMENIGKKVYLVGSDYVFPHLANVIVQDILHTQDGKVLGERYIPLGSKDTAQIIKEIQHAQPDVIINTLNGDSNAALFQAMKQAQLQDVPIVSFSLSENEAKIWGATLIKQHYAVWSYFQSLDNTYNTAFIKKYKQRFGAEKTISNPMISTYIGMHLWAKAAREAATVSPEKLISTLTRQTMPSPAGIVSIDASTHHLWQTPHIGKLKEDGQFDIIWRAERALSPEPFPSFRSKEEWFKLAAKFQARKAP